MRGAMLLPRYRDPIVRNVARLLLRSLQELHHAPTNTVVEMEARLGSITGHSRLFRLDVPLAVASPALMSEAARNLYHFNAGTMKDVSAAIQVALLEAGLVVRRQLEPQHAETQLFIHLDNEKRLECSYTMLSGASPSADGDDSPGVSKSTSFDENPLLLMCAATVKSGIVKRSVARSDVCCPGWCADVRFATAIEKKVPVELTDATEASVTMWRLRSRTRIPVGDFFSVDLSGSRSCEDAWWYPPPSVLGAGRGRSYYHTAGAATVKDVFTEGTVIPVPEMRIVDSMSNRKASLRLAEMAVEDVEVEVNLPAVLRAWKRAYGGAAVSNFLASSALVETTVAGTTPYTGVTLKPAAVATVMHSELGNEVYDYTVVQSEREDPFLLRVAEELMGVVQLLTTARVV